VGKCGINKGREQGSSLHFSVWSILNNVEIAQQADARQETASAAQWLFLHSARNLLIRRSEIGQLFRPQTHMILISDAQRL
jgi:hypothetical protein